MQPPLQASAGSAGNGTYFSVRLHSNPDRCACSMICPAIQASIMYHSSDHTVNFHCCVCFSFSEWRSGEVWRPAKPASVPTPPTKCMHYGAHIGKNTLIFAPISLFDCCFDLGRRDTWILLWFPRGSWEAGTWCRLFFTMRVRAAWFSLRENFELALALPK